VPDPARPDATTIAEPLLRTLRRHLACPRLEYASRPQVLADGVTARAFELRLAGAPPAISGPLVCRVLCDGGEARTGDPLLAESALHNALAAAGFPVPRVFATGTGDDELGAPFMLMERVAGRPAFGVFLGALAASIPLAALGIGAAPFGVCLAGWGGMALLLRRLHKIDGGAVAATLARAGAPMERLGPDAALVELDQLIRAASAKGLEPALDWLREHRPPLSGAPTVCHGDYWYGNVIVSARGVHLLDWTQAGLAHRELDLGWMSLQHYSRLPMAVPDPLFDWLWLPVRPLTWLFMAPIRWIYRLGGGVDPDRLAYYTALCATRLLANGAKLEREWRGRGGSRPAELSAWGSPHTRALLARRLRRTCGVDVRSQQS
jgi:aminoglycoside phosphotransferase